MKARLRAALMEIGHANEGERKVHKVMGKLHHDIRKVLSDQRAAMQTHATMPTDSANERNTRGQQPAA